jgi:Domain of unknown function (DUF4259)
MGTWGVGSFENDDAADWSALFEGADLETGLNLIRDALNFDGASSEGIRSLAEMMAVAAAEMVATINGHPVPPSPDLLHLDEIEEEEQEDEEEAESPSDERSRPGPRPSARNSEWQ